MELNQLPKKNKPGTPANEQLDQQQKFEEAIAFVDFNGIAKHQATRQKSWKLLSPGYFYGHEIPGLQDISEGYAWGYCPFCKEPEKSFCVNLKTGGYKCMAPECREEGSNMLTFARNYLGMDHHKAIRYLDAAHGEIE